MCGKLIVGEQEWTRHGHWAIAVIQLTVDGGLGLGSSCGDERMDFKYILEAEETRLSVLLDMGQGAGEGKEEIKGYSQVPV